MRRPPRRQDQHAVPRGRAGDVAALGIPALAKPALRLHLRLATCRNLLMRGARRSVERWGLTLPQFDVLAELRRSGKTGFTFVELSRVLLVTSGNLTGIVDRLEIDGLVRRQTDQRDRRLIRIVLTTKGRELVEEIVPQHARDIKALFAVMTPQQLAALNEMLGQLRNGLRDRPAAGGETDAMSARASQTPAQSRRSRGRNGAGRPHAPAQLPPR